MSFQDLEDQVYNTEGFTVSISGKALKVPQDYFKRAFSKDGSNSVSEWKQRFEKRYPGLSITAHKGNGESAHGNMLIGNLRSSYALSLLRREIESLKLELEYYKQVEDVEEVEGENEKDPFVILGVEKGCDLSEAKAAYRRKCQSFHPDKVPAQLHSDFSEFANKRTQEIIWAYTEIKKIHHMQDDEEGSE